MARGTSAGTEALFSDSGVRATALTRLIALAGAPITVYLAATRLAPASQGAYFVAVNLIAIAQLCEIGLGSIVVQFVSHEWPQLSRGPSGALTGGTAALQRYHAVVGAARTWYMRMAIVLAVAGGGGGLLLFAGTAELLDRQFVATWLALTACAAGYVVIVPLVATTEGAGDLLSVQRMRSWQAVALLVALWTGIASGDPLRGALFAAVAQLVIVLLWLRARRHGPAPLAGARVKTTDLSALAAHYRIEQGRNAAFWLALWAAPQFLTPIALRTVGGDEAGRLGVTLAIALAPLTLATAWLHGRYPSYGALVASGRVLEFAALARRATAQAVLIFLLGALAVLAVVLALPGPLPAFASRVLPPVLLVALFAGALVSLLLQAMAGWLRAHRDEGIAVRVVGGTVVTLLASSIAGAIGSVTHVVLAYAISSVGVALPLAALYFTRRRAESVR